MSRSRPQRHVSDSHYLTAVCCHGDLCPDYVSSDPALNLSSALMKCPGSSMHGCTR